MKKVSSFLTSWLLLLTGSSFSAVADDGPSVSLLARERFGFGIHAGTLGVGGHLNYELTDWMYVSGEMNGFAFSMDTDVDGVNYDGDLSLLSGGLTLNLRPFHDVRILRGFRLTGGGLFVDNSLEVEASSPGDVINIGDAPAYTLTAADRLTGRAEFSNLSPYVGPGWDWTFGKDRRFAISLDAGILFTGNPDVSLTPNGALLTQIPQAEFDKELNSFREDIKDLKYYPVVKLSFTWNL